MKKKVILEERRGGKTLGSIIKFLGEVILNPGIEKIFKDPIEEEYPKSQRMAHETSKDSLEKIIENLGLRDIEVYIDEGFLKAKCDWKAIYVGDDGFMYKKVSRVY